MPNRGHNATNVPHYAPSDMPKIDLSPNADWRDYFDQSQEKTSGKAWFAQAQIARRRYIAARFPEGTRFVLVRDVTVNEEKPASYSSADLQAWRAKDKVVTRRYTGVVRRMTNETWGGSSVLVTLDADSPKTGKSEKGQFGTVTFADCAKKVVSLPVLGTEVTFA